MLHGRAVACKSIVRVDVGKFATAYRGGRQKEAKFKELCWLDGNFGCQLNKASLPHSRSGFGRLHDGERSFNENCILRGFLFPSPCNAVSANCRSHLEWQWLSFSTCACDHQKRVPGCVWSVTLSVAWHMHELTSARTHFFFGTRQSWAAKVNKGFTSKRRIVSLFCVYFEYPIALCGQCQPCFLS